MGKPESLKGKFYSCKIQRLAGNVAAIVLFSTFFCTTTHAQVWQLSQPAGGAPGFLPSFGKNVYVGYANDPGIRLTRGAAISQPTVFISDSTYPGRSTKAFPKVALAEDGSALVFWIDGHDRFEAKWRVRKVAGDGRPLGDEMILAHIPTHGWWLDYDQQWDLASNGEQIVFTWEQNDDICYQLFDFDGKALTSPAQANQDTLVDSPFGEWVPATFTPSASMNGNGQFIIAWQDQRKAEMRFDTDLYFPAGDVGEIYARRFNHSGEPLGNNFTVNSDSVPRVQTRPAVGLNNNGTIFCLWLESDTAYASSMPPVTRGRIISASQSLNLAISGEAISYRAPSVAASETGFAALWEQEDGLYAQGFEEDGLTRPSSLVLARDVTGYAIAATAPNNYALLWSEHSPNEEPQLFAQNFAANLGTLSLKHLVADQAILQACASTFNQNLAVTYLSQQATAVGIVVTDLDLKSRYEIRRLNADLGGSSHINPACVRLKNGNFLAVWADWRNGFAAVYGQIVDAAGNKLGENFSIYSPNEYQSDQTPDVAALASGGAIVAYRSQMQTPSGAVFGAWLQQVNSDGRMIESPIQLNVTEARLTSVQVASLPEEPQRIAGVWREGQKIVGQLFDDRFNAIGAPKDLASQLYGFTAVGNSLGRFWLIGKEENSFNVILRGFDSALSPISDSIQLNDNENAAKPDLPPQIAALSDGRMLTVWAEREYSWNYNELHAQILDTDGSRLGKNFLVSGAPSEDAIVSITGLEVTAVDSLFVVSWSTMRTRRDCDIRVVWINADGKLAKSPVSIHRANFVTQYQLFPENDGRLTFLHEAYGNANTIDVAFDMFQPSFLNSPGWYVSPVWRNPDTLIWKKLAWQADTPAGTGLRVSFRTADNIYNPLDTFIPWQEIVNGQTDQLPTGRHAQWRVELDGTSTKSPRLFDLIGEYDVKTEVADSQNPLPLTLDLLPSFPNPMRYAATIVYQLPSVMDAAITIHNLLGQKVRSWQFKRKPAGRHSLVWDGKDENGIQVSNGIYFLRLVSAHQQILRKITITQ